MARVEMEGAARQFHRRVRRQGEWRTAGEAVGEPKDAALHLNQPGVVEHKP